MESLCKFRVLGLFISERSWFIGLKPAKMSANEQCCRGWPPRQIYRLSSSTAPRNFAGCRCRSKPPRLIIRLRLTATAAWMGAGWRAMPAAMFAEDNEENNKIFSLNVEPMKLHPPKFFLLNANNLWNSQNQMFLRKKTFTNRTEIGLKVVFGLISRSAGKMITGLSGVCPPYRSFYAENEGPFGFSACWRV